MKEAQAQPCNQEYSVCFVELFLHSAYDILPACICQEHKKNASIGLKFQKGEIIWFVSAKSRTE